MKKNLQAKYLSTFLGLLFLFNSLPINVLAQGISGEALDTVPLTSTTTITKIGSTTIVNRSDNKFFVPNKTISEIQSFANNAPNYVTVSVCGDGVQGEGETWENCKIDASPLAQGCGDGICDKANVIYKYNPPIWVNNSVEYCNGNYWGSLNGASVIAAAGTALACTVGGVIGCALASALFGPSLSYLFIGPQCTTVNQPQEVKENY